MLQRAYEVLATDEEARLPCQDRHAWLSAARLVRTAQKISRGITEKSHRDIYDDTEEYWRSRFYDLIQAHGEGLPGTYYAERPEHMLAYSGRVREPLAESSLAVLYRFVRWPEPTPDPLEGEPPFSDEEIHKMSTFGPRGLGRLLAQVREISRGRRRPLADPGGDTA